MININISNLASNIFEMSEETIYNVINKFNNSPSADKILTYVYIKAFYIHMVRIYLSNKNNLEKFNDIILEYKNSIIIYYKNNNPQISNELLDNIVNAFDTSFNIIETLNYNNLEDGYELRHHVIDSCDLLRIMLEKKSKSNIRTDIFENSISEIRNQTEKILNYISNCNILN